MIRATWFVPPTLATISEVRGLLARRGISLQSTLTKSSDEQFDALTTGRCDFAVTAIDNILAWNAKAMPGDFRVIAQIERTTPLSLVARAGVAGIRDLRDSDLLVDAPENGFVIALRAMLADHGVEPGSYRLIQAGGVKERLATLVAGQGAATLLGPPFDSQALAAGFTSLGTINALFPDFPGQGVVVRLSSLSRAHKAVAAWLAAIEEARLWVVDHASEARELLAGGAIPAPVVEAMLGSCPRSLVPNRDGIALLIDQRRRLGLLAAEARYETMVDTRFFESGERITSAAAVGGS